MSEQSFQPSQAMEQMIGKAVSDSDFRQQLVENPGEAVRSAGIQLSPEELQTLESTSREERSQMLEQLGERTSPWFDGWTVSW
jgi:hypothetical protein